KQGRPQKDKPAVGPDALIAATRELMKSMPPGQITRLHIARAAGVDPGLIRYYFGDKSAVLGAAVLQAGAGLRARRAGGYAEGTSPRDRIRRRMFILLETLSQTHRWIISSSSGSSTASPRPRASCATIWSTTPATSLPR